MAEQQTQARKLYIDIIRAFSVCLIFLYHFSGYIKPVGFTDPICYSFANGIWGNVGVFLFFMISGNCLISKYRESFEWKKFYKTRFVKIMIPFWVCYVAVFLLNFWQTKTFPEGPLYKFIYTIIGMDGYWSYKTQTFYLLGEWFLGSIIFLYFLFPLVRVCVKKNIHITLLVLLALNGLLYYNNFFGFFEIPVEWNLLVGLFYFVLGAWIEEAVKMLRNRNLRMAVLTFVFVFGAITLFVKLPISKYVGGMIVSIFFYLFFMQLECILKVKVIAGMVSWLSRNSYLIFLVHHVVIRKVAEHFAGRDYSVKGAMCILVICILVIAACVAAYHKLFSSKKS